MAAPFAPASKHVCHYRHAPIAMSPSQADRDTLERLEEDLWQAETRFDLSLMEKIFAPDFVEFGRSGRVYDRQTILAVPRGPLVARLPLQNFRVRLLAPDVAQVTYDSAVTYDGAVLHGRRSSIWTRNAGGWVLRFHQGTPYDGDAD